MFKRKKYQHGSLSKEKRSHGTVWIFRWREVNAHGVLVHRKVTVGTVEQYRTKSLAQKAVASLQIRINDDSRFGSATGITVEQLVTHYRQHELGREDTSKAQSTKDTYNCIISKWILPRWKDDLLRQVKAVDVEKWLGEQAVANGTKAKIRGIMSALFNHALRHELTDKNPIKLVRQSAKRERVPAVLTVDELSGLLGMLVDPYRSMVLLAATSGLRVSELLALKWADIDFSGLAIKLSRGIVHQHIGKMKTEASRKSIPLDPEVARALTVMRKLTPYDDLGDWVFASPQKQGKQPFWPENALRRHVRPAAEKANINKLIGWHTFRHTHATLLNSNGASTKIVQESLRHSNSRTTMDTYTQAVASDMRDAQSRVVRMILPVTQRTGMEAS